MIKCGYLMMKPGHYYRNNANVFCERIEQSGVCKLDATVTIQTFHLTKLPLTIHSAIGHVTQPIDESFNIETDAIHYSDVTQEMMNEWISIVECCAADN